MLDLTRPLSGSFERIVHAREAQILRIAFRILENWADAEDVAQETFFRLFTGTASISRTIGH